ncbi:hypothetical protein Tco_1252330 [Tanacetum coccineum]
MAHSISVREQVLLHRRQTVVIASSYRIPFQEDPPVEPWQYTGTMASIAPRTTVGSTPWNSQNWLQLDTFYNALNINDQDSLNSAAGGNFLDKMPRECLKIIESKSKVRQTRAKAVVAKTRRTKLSAPAPSPAPVKLVEPKLCLLGGVPILSNCQPRHGNIYRDNISEYVSQAAAR